MFLSDMKNILQTDYLLNLASFRYYRKAKKRVFKIALGTRFIIYCDFPISHILEANNFSLSSLRGNYYIGRMLVLEQSRRFFELKLF